MTETNISENRFGTDSITVPAFGYELIREVLLPDILGKEAGSILYWAGKDLARKYPLNNIDEIIAFFEKAGWGTLTIKEETKNVLQLELSSPLVSSRLHEKEDSTFQIEAGFLAQQIESQKKVVTETYEHPKKRLGKVHFTVKWDRKDFID